MASQVVQTIYPEPPASCKVYTPPELANAIVSLLKDAEEGCWLEPSAGQGVFVQAMHKIGVPAKRIVAVDLDPIRSSNDSLAKIRRGVDFLEWARTARTRFDRVVGNPPYVAISCLEPSMRDAAVAIEGPSGLKVPLSANTWYAFVCASLRLLKPGGAFGLVLPASWDYADYATPLRDTMQELFEEVYVLRSKKPMFESVQDGSVVIISIGFGEGSCTVKRLEYDDLNALIKGLKKLRRTPAKERESMFRGAQSETSFWRLGDELQIRLGGVTGQSSYFLLTEERRILMRLPTKALRPVVTRARHLISGTLTKRDWEKLRKSGERIWLFDPPDHLTTHPAVHEYLSLLPDNGGCDKTRHKISSRRPWYRTPLPRAIDGFMSGMSRHGPWISFRAMNGLNASNTLYTVHFRHRFSSNQRYAYALSLLTTSVRKRLHEICRRYADGLEKFEPGDLLQLEAPLPQRHGGAKGVYAKAVQSLLAGDVQEACRIADSYLPQKP